MKQIFADIVLPVAVKGHFTYIVPNSLVEMVEVGSIVLVPFSSAKLYAGVVIAIHDNNPQYPNIKAIFEVKSDIPAINSFQLQLWKWIASYYMCSEGEVFKAALPTLFTPDSDKMGGYKERHKPHIETFISLADEYRTKDMSVVVDALYRAPKQKEVLLSYLQLSMLCANCNDNAVRKSDVLHAIDGGGREAALDSLIKKGILIAVEREVSRLNNVSIHTVPPMQLTATQQKAYNEIVDIYRTKNTVLLHGVTSSGKTELYIHLIKRELSLGKQVLYMLPEIALTTQIINRLRNYFANSIGIYHSRFSDEERGEIWQKVANGTFSIVIGVRSSLFLPFNNLGLIIIDEEHDGSYKQEEPSPRYNARDTALMMAKIYGAKTLLGSASPSIESYANTFNGKYGLVELTERYGNVKMPEIIIANVREARRKRLMVSHFTPELIEAMSEALSNREQIILFQNRRGFAPYLICSECGKIPMCKNCDVSLTYHKSINRLVCHYCGNTLPVSYTCDGCNSQNMNLGGFGTEKIEDEIKIIFPNAVVARMDRDTTQGKNSFEKIISRFEKRQIDILIGTQMISKGLDFENLTVVGVLDADSMMNFPDYRSSERSYQMLEQVSGRAGRRNKVGKVIIQTSTPDNPVIDIFLNHDYRRMFLMQMDERNRFNYPPFCKIVTIRLKYRDKELLKRFSDELAKQLRIEFGEMKVLGPEFPVVSRIRQNYIVQIMIKMELCKEFASRREKLISIVENVKKTLKTTMWIGMDIY